MTPERDGIVWDAARLHSPHTQRDKSARVRRMFDAIAPTYERVNAVASAGRDARWRREMVRLADVRAEDVLLDIACGTGDVARTFAAGDPRPAMILGLDFSGPMLDEAVRRPIRRGTFVQADALRIPLAPATASIATCAFGVRNFQDLAVGLAEMYRVLRPGGRAVILEFSLPRNRMLRKLYLLYFNRIMPVLATWISRDGSGAYRYLPRSVVSFHGRDELMSCFRAAGFTEVAAHSRTMGIVTIFVARKSLNRPPEQGTR